MTGHAQLKFVMTECSKTQIRGSDVNDGLHPTHHILGDYFSCESFSDLIYLGERTSMLKA